jgi:hypothetical protein
VAATAAGVVVAALPAREAAAENQPHMRAALQALQNARAQLRQATSDKGGHRVRALNNVEAAIMEVQQGINFDNRR